MFGFIGEIKELTSEVKEQKKRLDAYESRITKHENNFKQSIDARHNNLKKEVNALTERVATLEQTTDILAHEILELQPKTKIKRKVNKK